LKASYNCSEIQHGVED